MKKKRLDRLNKIQKKAAEIAQPLINEMTNNRLAKGESSVSLYSNSWVVKSHNNVVGKFDFKIK